MPHRIVLTSCVTPAHWLHGYPLAMKRRHASRNCRHERFIASMCRFCETAFGHLLTTAKRVQYRPRVLSFGGTMEQDRKAEFIPSRGELASTRSGPRFRLRITTAEGTCCALRTQFVSFESAVATARVALRHGATDASIEDENGNKLADHQAITTYRLSSIRLANREE